MVPDGVHSGRWWKPTSPGPHLAIPASRDRSRVGRDFTPDSVASAPGASTVVLAACLSNVAVFSTYYSYMLRYGGVKEWTDAIYPAVEALPALRPSHVCFLDWGFHDNVRLLTQGRVNVCTAADATSEAESAKRQMALPDVVYMTHTKANQLQPELTKSFLALAASEGYRTTAERVFYDYNGRPMIEIFKLFRP